MMSTLWIGIATVLGRNLSGWIKNSISDGKIQPYEVKQLIISSIVTSGVFILTFLGLANLDVNNSEWISSAGTLIITPIIDKLLKRFDWFNDI